MSAKIAAALIDLSGTLHVEDVVIPGAIEALRRYLLLLSLTVIHLSATTYCNGNLNSS
jgi:ribonucleotide monophosphatase NagD (HAD superfamily)